MAHGGKSKWLFLLLTWVDYGLIPRPSIGAEREDLRAWTCMSHANDPESHYLSSLVGEACRQSVWAQGAHESSFVGNFLWRNVAKPSPYHYWVCSQNTNAVQDYGVSPPPPLPAPLKLSVHHPQWFSRASDQRHRRIGCLYSTVVDPTRFHPSQLNPQAFDWLNLWPWIGIVQLA